MKAEQRKELETNTLADKMGRMMQRVKGGQRRTMVLYILAGALLVVVLFVAYRWWDESRVRTSMEWINLYDGGEKSLIDLARTEKGTFANKATRFQFAWILYWDGGIRAIAADKSKALKAIKDAGGI